MFLHDYQKIKIIFFSIYIWFTLLPFFVWNKKYLIPIFLFLTMLFFLSEIKNRINIKNILIFFILIHIIFIYYMLNKASLEWSLIMCLSISIFFILSEKTIINVFLTFKKIFSITLLPSIFLWLFHVLGIDINTFSMGIIDAEIINVMKAQESTNYVIFPGAVIFDYMLNWEIFRLQGMYDEPGVVGTICALILISDKMKLNNFFNIIIFIGGVMSLSIAFYIMILIYILFNLRKYFVFMIKMILISVIIYNLSPSSYKETIENKLISRFKIDNNYNLSGNNRESGIQYNYIQYLSSNTKELLLGLDRFELDGSSSWKNILISSGIIGISIILIFYSLIIFNLNFSLNYQHFIFIFIFILSFLQRPQIIHPSYALIFIYAMYSLQVNFSKNINFIKEFKCAE